MTLVAILVTVVLVVGTVVWLAQRSARDNARIRREMQRKEGPLGIARAIREQTNAKRTLSSSE